MENRGATRKVGAAEGTARSAAAEYSARNVKTGGIAACGIATRGFANRKS